MLIRKGGSLSVSSLRTWTGKSLQNCSSHKILEEICFLSCNRSVRPYYAMPNTFSLCNHPVTSSTHSGYAEKWNFSPRTNSNYLTFSFIKFLLPCPEVLLWLHRNWRKVRTNKHAIMLKATDKLHHPLSKYRLFVYS